MKNAILYYYNIKPDNLRKKGNSYNFENNGNTYILEESKRSKEEIVELFNLSYYLYVNNIYMHQMILNNNNEIITRIDNKDYILMLKYNNDINKVNLKDIVFFKLPFNFKYNYIVRNNWRKLWTSKIDNIESQISEHKHKYKMIQKSIDYFIGLAENAIQLLLYANKEPDLFISYINISKNSSVNELYNPLNMIIDSRVRLLCEYIRGTFFDDNMCEEEIINIINSYNLNRNEKILFFSRILFPTFYFEIYEKIILEAKEEKNIEICIKNIDKNNKLISLIYNEFSRLKIIPEIEWIKKM